ALYQHPHRIARRANQNDARRRADAALEAEADHAGPAADAALLDRAGLGRIERGCCCLRRDVETFEIVEVAAPGLGNYRPGGFAKGLRRPLLDSGIDLADRIGIADPDRSLDDA